jgi:glycosyltransferase involved in cell wall biosynthesis
VTGSATSRNTRPQTSLGRVRVGINLSFLTPREMGGLEVYSRELVKALSTRHDLELTLFVNRVAAEDAFWADQGTVVTVPVDARRRASWVAGDQLHVPRLARRAGVELVHSLSSTAPIAGSVKRVVTVHDLNYLVHPESHFGARALGMRMLVPLAVRRCQRVIVPSASTRNDLVERLRADPGKIDVVPEGIGQPPGLTATDRSGERQRLALCGRPMLLTVSAKRPHKNLRRLLAALAAIPEQRRPVLVLPGYATPHEAELRALAGELGLADQVRFLGWVSQEELEDLYAACDGFVFPSLCEGFGLPVLEAMARGVPVATSGRSSLAEVAGDAALLFDPEDEYSMATAIQRLLTDPRLAERLALAGKQQAARFTWESAAQGTVESYRRALAA